MKVGAAIAALLPWVSSPALAHAFGERYDLPLPLELYLGGAAAAVAVSFLIAGLVVKEHSWPMSYPRLNLSEHFVGKLATKPALAAIARLLSVLLFAAIVFAGLFGNQDPLRNLAPVTVWIVWWVGMAVVSAFIGDVWALINPWIAVFSWAEAIWRRARPGRDFALGMRYPSALGTWPAVLLLLGFTWSELISPRPAVPSYIASMALAYSFLTWTGMFVFGRDAWLRHGEVFSVVFSLLARFAPFAARGGSLELRPFALGLLEEGAASVSMVAFVLLYLVSVIYDGLLVTPAWAWMESQTEALIPLPPDEARMAVRTLGLFGVWFLCAGAYSLACWVMAAIADGDAGAGAVARLFIFTLVPIVIAYHFAHYFTYLLVQGQYVIPLASDPLGRGWNLFGTAAYRPDIGFVGARFAWYAAVVAIVAGHIVAVFLAHARTVASFPARRPALWSELPLTALMVLFTVASLSILAEPIVQQGRPAVAAEVGSAAVAMPADALVPEPGTGRFLPAGDGQTAGAKLVYGAMASPFHDGTAMTAADLLFPYSFAYRWGAGAAHARHDPSIDAATALLRSSLKALRFAGIDATSRTVRFGDLTYARERLLVEVYLSVPAQDVNAAAALAPPWSPLPWHVIALLEEAVVRGWAAFSRVEASRLGVEWLDPVRSESLKQRLKALVTEFERDGYVPAALAGLVTRPAARARWKALSAFYTEHKHFLVTNGPYRIKEWPSDAAVLEVVRDPRYPLGVGSYDSYAIPRRAFVTNSQNSAQEIVLHVEVEVIDRVMRDFSIARRPLKEAVANFGRRAIPDCRYVVIDAQDRVVAAGDGHYREDGAMLLALEGKLAPGRYTVSVALYPYGNTVNAEVKRIAYEVPPR